MSPADQREAGGRAGERERELEFLVRSLHDLDAERAAGDLDDATYERLRSEYVEREAAVRRATSGEGGQVVEAAAEAGPRQPAWRTRLLVFGAIGAFAAMAAVVLTLALSDRLPGQTASGNTDPVEADDRLARLEADVEQRPDDPLAHLFLARYLLNQEGDFAGALREYDAAAALDATNPEPAAYAGWVLYLASNSAPDVDAARELIGAAIGRLDAAVAADPDYPDARAFRGIVRFRGLGDAAGAVPDLQRFLAAAPDHFLAPDVRELLAAAVAQSDEQEEAP